MNEILLVLTAFVLEKNQLALVLRNLKSKRHLNSVLFNVSKPLEFFEMHLTIVRLSSSFFVTENQISLS